MKRALDVLISLAALAAAAVNDGDNPPERSV